MNKIRLVLLFLTIGLSGHLLGQIWDSKIIYQRNPNGVIEVYQKNARGGGPSPKDKIAEIKKNSSTGTIEVINFKPRYSEEDNKRYRLSNESLINQVNAMNKQFADNITIEKERRAAQEQQTIKKIEESIQTIKAKNDEEVSYVRQFYSSFTDYPTHIKDGWHSAYTIHKNSGAFKDIGNFGDFAINRDFFYIRNNKIERYWYSAGNNNLCATERKLSVNGEIKNAKAIIKTTGASNYIEVYFTDEIIDPDYTINNFNPGFIKINIPSSCYDNMYKFSAFAYIYTGQAKNYSINNIDDMAEMVGKKGDLSFWGPEMEIMILNPLSPPLMCIVTNNFKYTWNLHNINVHSGQTSTLTLSIR